MEDKIYKQNSLFSFMYEPKRITKPIRLIELFAGIGSQYKALKVLTDKVESHKIVEWAYNSICSYNAIHIKDFKDYSEGKTREEMISRINGISTNYNEPLTLEQLRAKPIAWVKNAYNNCIATNNLINVMAVHYNDLEITDTDKYEYVLTYSFPCQDLSLAGDRGGMSTSQAEGGTRSGLLWEVERILDEGFKQHKPLPNCLIMENVPEVIGANNIKDFKKWEQKLCDLGYSNYIEVLNAKDYGIPQNRKRCFMVSILGDYSYEFPIPLKLNRKLKDFLEKEVDEKYFLNAKMIKYITADNEKWTGNNDKALVNKSIASTINTKEGGRRCDASNYVCDDLPTDYDLKKVYNSTYLNETLEQNEIKDGSAIDTYNRRVVDDVMPTITTRVSVGNQTFVAIKENTKDGYKLATEGDGINCSTRMEHQRGNVKKGMAQTLTTHADIGVLVPHKNDLRIRKLTPKECTRLMGFSDSDYYAMQVIGMSDGAIYHCCGDSIVVSVLISIFSQLINGDDKHIDIVNNYVEKDLYAK